MHQLMIKIPHTSRVPKAPRRGPPGGLMSDKISSPEKPERLISSSIEEIHNRAETISPLLQELLDRRPPPHWGLNE